MTEEIELFDPVNVPSSVELGEFLGIELLEGFGVGGGGGPSWQGVNHQTGTTYNVDLVTDKQKLITLDNTSPVTVTLPPTGDIIIDSYNVAPVNYNWDDNLSIYDNRIHGQSFTASVSAPVERASFIMKRILGPVALTGTVVAQLCAHVGVYGTSSTPGTVLATSNPLDLGIVTITPIRIFFNFPTPYTVTAGTHYVIILVSDIATSIPCVMAADDVTILGHSGNEIETELAWPDPEPDPNEDVIFEIRSSGAPIDNKWFAFFENLGPGLVTITSNSSIDDVGSITLEQNTGVFIACDGYSYYTSRGVGGEHALTFIDSLNRVVNTINLDNDSSAPGNNKVYGTDGTGVKGWQTPPTRENLLTFADSLNRVSDTINLDGDAGSPGGNKLYGTDGSGIKGWFPIPAFTPGEVPLTFVTPLIRTINTITLPNLNGGTTNQVLKKISNTDFDYGWGTGSIPVAHIGNFGFTWKKSSGLTVGKIAGYWTCPYAGNITAWNLMVDSGSITIKIWKSASGAVPTSANAINTAGISLSGGTAIHSTTLTDFTTLAVTAGDIFACEITAVAGVTDFGGAVEITRT